MTKNSLREFGTKTRFFIAEKIFYRWNRWNRWKKNAKKNPANFAKIEKTKKHVLACWDRSKRGAGGCRWAGKLGLAAAALLVVCKTLYDPHRNAHTHTHTSFDFFFSVKKCALPKFFENFEKTLL